MIKVQAENGFGRASASTGSTEACEKRDRDTRRYGGKGVLKAVETMSFT